MEGDLLVVLLRSSRSREEEDGDGGDKRWSRWEFGFELAIDLIFLDSRSISTSLQQVLLRILT